MCRFPVGWTPDMMRGMAAVERTPARTGKRVVAAERTPTTGAVRARAAARGARARQSARFAHASEPVGTVSSAPDDEVGRIIAVEAGRGARRWLRRDVAACRGGVGAAAVGLCADAGGAEPDAAVVPPAGRGWQGPR